MEAMWTRFQPVVVKIRELIADGAIGEVRQVQADLGVDRPYDPKDRLFDPAQGGGAMLDLGVYVVSIAQHFLGDPTIGVRQRVTGPDRRGRGGRAAARLRRRAGRLAADVAAQPDSRARPGCTARGGWIEIPPRFHHPKSFVLNRPGHEPGEVRPAAARRRLQPRADRGHAVPARGPDARARSCRSRTPSPSSACSTTPASSSASSTTRTSGWPCEHPRADRGDAGPDRRPARASSPERAPRCPRWWSTSWSD